MSKKQKRALRYLVLGWKTKEVAKELGLAQITVAKWMADPVFRSEWERLDSAFIEALDSRIKKVRTKAIDVLEKMLTSNNEASKRFAVQQALALSQRATPKAATQIVKHEHTGTISQTHSGEIDVNKIPKEARKGLMAFLEATRDVSSAN